MLSNLGRYLIMESIKLQQIFFRTDCRKGYDALWAELKKGGYSQSLTPNGHVFLFFNRGMNILKIVARRGVYTEKLPPRERWDLKLRKNQVFEIIGKAFGLNWSVSNQVFYNARMESRKKNGR
jgi:hypothetical protein